MEAIAELDEFDMSSFTPMLCDLNDFACVRKFCQDVTEFANEKPVDRLVCNAAVYQPSLDVPKWSVDGIEQQMQSNFLSHFLMISLLMPFMKGAAGTTPSFPLRPLTLHTYRLLSPSLSKHLISHVAIFLATCAIPNRYKPEISRGYFCIFATCLYVSLVFSFIFLSLGVFLRSYSCFARSPPPPPPQSYLPWLGNSVCYCSFLRQVHIHLSSINRYAC